MRPCIVRAQLVLTAFNHAPRIASLPTIFSSLDYLIHDFGHRPPLICYCVLNLLESTKVPISVRCHSYAYVSLQIHVDYYVKLKTLTTWNNGDIFPILKLPKVGIYIFFRHQSSVHSLRGSIRLNLKKSKLHLQHHSEVFQKLLSNYSLVPQWYKKKNKIT